MVRYTPLPPPSPVDLLLLLASTRTANVITLYSLMCLASYHILKPTCFPTIVFDKRLHIPREIS